jgi:S1-C subfamily serine protease
VPVTVIDGQVIVGFDRERIEGLLGRHAGRPHFGAAVADAARMTADAGGGPVSGAYIGQVRSGTVADRMHLAAGDIILSVDGQAVADAAGLALALGRVAPDGRFEVTLLRGGKKYAVTGIMR